MPESERRTVSFRTLALETGPRFARDALGPALVFYLGWKLVGLAVGVLAATLFALVAYGWERTRARSGLSAGVGLGIALVQAAAALASGSAIAYFGPPVIINGAYGLAFVVSVVIGRPLAGIFAQETYPFSPEVRASATFRRVFSRISLVWGVFLLARSATRLLALSWRDVEMIVLVNIATGIPVTAALMSWSFWYSARRLRQSAELGGSAADRALSE
jgi:hypothetical protein